MGSVTDKDRSEATEPLIRPAWVKELNEMAQIIGTGKIRRNFRDEKRAMTVHISGQVRNGTIVDYDVDWTYWGEAPRNDVLAPVKALLDKARQNRTLMPQSESGTD